MIELSDKSSHLNSMSIYPKCDHTLYSVLITVKEMALLISPLAYFIFFFLLFQVRSLIIITCLHHHHGLYFMWPSPSMSATWLLHLGWTNLSQIHTQSIGLVQIGFINQPKPCTEPSVGLGGSSPPTATEPLEPLVLLFQF
jgi:hypothetical protein